MIITSNERNTPSNLLGRYIPEWSSHEHIPQKSDTVMDTILADHSITAFAVAKRVAMGAFCGLTIGAGAYLFKPGDKKILNDRIVLEPRYNLID